MASDLAPRTDALLDTPAVVAFYLPQYHAIAENDEWWGEGFTDWLKVAAARPLYPGHPLPYVPTELGPYDLRDQEVRRRQAELARAYGIFGFCYYFYWFGGRRLLERPLEAMLVDGEPALPFCLCWANEPWTRRWDGRETDVLMAQHHDPVRDLAVLDDLMPYFEDERYIRIRGCPVLLVYRPSLMVDPEGFASRLREEAVRRGLLGLHLCNVMSIGDNDRRAPGFDAAVEFPPNGTIGKEIDPRVLGVDPSFHGRIYDYASLVRTVLARPTPAFPYYPGVMPRWDNTARKGMAAHIFHGSSPAIFESWLQRAASITRFRNPRAPLVFINSWNEWAEGAHLEPDQQTGRRYLEVVRRVVSASAGDHRVADADGFCQGSPQAVDVANEDVERSHPPSPGETGLHDKALVTLRPGMPDLGKGSNLMVSDGVGRIDETDGGRLVGQMVSAKRADVLLLRGWFYGDSRVGGRHGGRAFLVLSDDESAWHAPIVERHPRRDLQRGLLARDRATRRLVRVLDRLHPNVARSALHIWAGGRDSFGFELLVRLDTPLSGTYRIGFVDATASGSYLVRTEFVLEVT